MKISELSKNKNKIITQEKDNPTSINVNNKGEISVNKNDIKIGIAEKDKSQIKIISKDPVFNTNIDKEKKISVVMTPGLVGPPGEPGRDGEAFDQVYGEVDFYIEDLALEDISGKREIDGYIVKSPDTVFIGTYGVFRVNDSGRWVKISNIQNLQIVNIKKGIEYEGVSLKKLENQNPKVVRSPYKHRWHTKEVI